jgi:flagellar biosynthetic protein FliR
MVEIAPLLSSRAIPQIAKIGLSFFLAAIVMPGVLESGYVIPNTPLEYLLLAVGEALIGVIIGFFLVLIFSAFQLAGQFFSLQMGFGASQVFDPLAQIQIPLMGQFLNIIAMFVFLFVSGFSKFIMVGISRSFEALKAVDLVAQKGVLFDLFVSSLGGLFQTALTIAFPFLGTLLLVSVSTGLLAKAAPQMNILMIGFPIAIGVAFLVLFLLLPFIMNAFGAIIDMSFENLSRLILRLRGS